MRLFRSSVRPRLSAAAMAGISGVVSAPRHDGRQMEHGHGDTDEQTEEGRGFRRRRAVARQRRRYQDRLDRRDHRQDQTAHRNRDARFDHFPGKAAPERTGTFSRYFAVKAQQIDSAAAFGQKGSEGESHQNNG